MNEYQSEQLKNQLIKELQGRKTLKDITFIIERFSNRYQSELEWNVKAIAIRHKAEVLGPYGVMQAWLEVDVSGLPLVLKVISIDHVPQYVVEALSKIIKLVCTLNQIPAGTQKKIGNFVANKFDSSLAKQFFSEYPDYQPDGENV